MRHLRLVSNSKVTKYDNLSDYMINSHKFIVNEDQEMVIDPYDCNEIFRDSFIDDEEHYVNKDDYKIDILKLSSEGS